MKLDINDTHLHVTQRGEGSPALVFLHYYGGSSRTWESVINILPNDYQTIAYDHRDGGSLASRQMAMTSRGWLQMQKQ